MNSKERREILLRKYIEEVKQFPNVFPNGYDDEGKGSFICPLCLRILNIAQLGEQVNLWGEKVGGDMTKEIWKMQLI